MATTYDKASLVMIPSGYKDDKLYSIKPTDGSGDFTFSRDGSGASPATRVNAEGLIEKGRENLTTWSNDLNNWIKDLTSVTSGQSGYDGSNDAWRIDSTGGYVRRDVTYSGVVTYSIYAKAGTAVGIRIRLDAASDRNAYFNLSTGAEIGSHTGIDLKATDLGSGWYRLAFAADITTGVNHRIYPVDASGVSTTGNIFVQDAQLESGLVATDYIETTTTAVSAGLLGDMPRLDYSGGASCPSLLLEPSRTNIIPQSEYFGGYTLVNVTADANNATSPEGVTNAYKIIEDSANTNKHFRAANTSLAASTYAVSAFIKPNNCDVISLREGAVSGDAFTYKFSTGTSSIQGSRWDGATIQAEDYGNGWYRVSANFTATSAASHNFRIHLLGNDFNQTTNPSVGTYTYTGDGASGIWVYGFMAELGSYPTSYIPTYGSASLRGADDCEKTGLSSIIGQTEGTLFIDYTASHEGGNGERILAIGDGTASNRIVLFEASNKIRVYAADSGSLQWDYITTIDFEGTHKIAVTYAANSAAIYIDGTEIETDSSFVVPSCNNVYLGTSEAFGVSLGGTIKEAILFDSTLTDAECIALTTI